MKSLTTIFSVVLAVVQSQQTFNNPVLWEDLADIDVFRVDDVYYYSASTMHYSPGAPILQSLDLVNWEFVGHSVPTLDFLDNPAYDLTDGRAYVEGIWASFLRYRSSNGLFYWGGCIQFTHTYIYTSPSPTGPWQQSSMIDTCYYDAGLLIDDTDTMYVSFGSTNISVAKLSPDGLSEVSSQIVYNSTVGYIEGSRMYQINGIYYIIVTQPSATEYVLKSSGGPFGPYEIGDLVSFTATPVSGAGYPHQGGLVDTPDGDWYYMSFVDAYPGGRIPVLAPMTFDANGWPAVDLIDGAWATSYAMPTDPQVLASPTGIDSFSGTSLGPQWEWNHNPDTTKFSVNNGLTLQTATVTTDLYSARNTLTHRILGPNSTATIKVDYSSMVDGDQAGLALFRDSSAWIGIVRDAGVYSVVVLDDITMDESWNTATFGTEVARAGGLPCCQIWLRVYADIAPDGTHQGIFSYSVDGDDFVEIGGAFDMITNWTFFMGYRFGIFNHATISLGGSVFVEQFEISQ
ncbi:glycoside hydrolase family 43 protein [Coleophoma cylindrospora]|uniref:Glycoside hydrolase family 43 protein n=1 Tax=Coleophoma cylindrospora TaxID=1849047 RepID=A0A3D8RN53_9HELO|nr:glycoside hydrolase family 43 protein [Coleophoma cylindrospora]